MPRTPRPGNLTLKLLPQDPGPRPKGRSKTQPLRAFPSGGRVGGPPPDSLPRCPHQGSQQLPDPALPQAAENLGLQYRPGRIPEPPSRGFPHIPPRRGVLGAPPNPGHCLSRSSRVPLGGRGFTSTPARLDPRGRTHGPRPPGSHPPRCLCQRSAARAPILQAALSPCRCLARRQPQPAAR